MHKIEEIEIVEVKRRHMFYCDNCKKYIDDSIECEDGWFESFGEREQSIFINKKGKYILKGILCDECYLKQQDEIVNVLSDLGFEKER